MTDLLVGKIFEDSSGLTDAAVMGAMRSCLKGTSPDNVDSQRLCDRFEEIAQRSDVEIPPYRRALEQLLELATQHRDAKHPTAFLRYLSLLAE